MGVRINEPTGPRVVTASMLPIRLWAPPRLARFAKEVFGHWPSDDEIVDAILNGPAHYSKTNSWENGLLLLAFNNTNFANVGDATGLRGSSTAGSFYLSLHTSDPGEAGDQTSNETTYTSYARKAVARSGSGFTVSGNSCTLASAVSFDACTGGTATITHAGVGTASSSTGVLLYKGAVSPNISVSSGVTPQLTTSSSVTED